MAISIWSMLGTHQGGHKHTNKANTLQFVSLWGQATGKKPHPSTRSRFKRPEGTDTTTQTYSDFMPLQCIHRTKATNPLAKATKFEHNRKLPFMDHQGQTHLHRGGTRPHPNQHAQTSQKNRKGTTIKEGSSLFHVDNRGPTIVKKQGVTIIPTIKIQNLASPVCQTQPNSRITTSFHILCTNQPFLAKTIL